MCESPKKSYQEQCEQLHYKCNTGVYNMLPDKYDSLKDIVSLDLRRNCLGRNGIRPLLPILAECTNLERLVLADNYLSNDNMELLCDTLRHCRRLRSLDLSGNPISQPSGKLLCRLVDDLPLLADLGLHRTLMNPGLARVAMRKAAARSVDGAGAIADASSLRYQGLRLLGEVCSELVTHANSASSSTSLSANTSGGHHSKAALSVPAAVTDSAAALSSSAAAPPARQPDDAWYAMETIWDVAAVAAPPEDGWSGLASVMALVRQDESIASLGVAPSSCAAEPRPAA